MGQQVRAGRQRTHEQRTAVSGSGVLQERAVGRGVQGTLQEGREVQPWHVIGAIGFRGVSAVASEGCLQ